MIKFRFLILLLNFCIVSLAQNNVRLLSANGNVFTAKTKNILINQHAQSTVLIENITEDTLHLVLEFENGMILESSVYLLEKGKTCKGKEFSYRIDLASKPAKIVYMGMYDITALPNPLVPNKPVVDTMPAYRNRFMGHLCELKNGKPVYFNNVPKNGKCKVKMPDEYIDFARALIKNAQVEEEKVITIENICRNNCLSVAQFSVLVDQINYEIEKIKLLKVAYFHFTDPENAKDLEGSFRFAASLTELRNFLKKPDEYAQLSGSNCSVASDSAAIQKFVSLLAIYPNDAERYVILKKSYTSYCYSIHQVEEIMKQFIHDREKTETAKTLYFYCVEKENYLLLLDLFSYNESKNTLRNFVEKQGK